MQTKIAKGRIHTLSYSTLTIGRSPRYILRIWGCRDTIESIFTAANTPSFTSKMGPSKSSDAYDQTLTESLTRCLSLGIHPRRREYMSHWLRDTGHKCRYCRYSNVPNLKSVCAGVEGKWRGQPCDRHTERCPSVMSAASQRSATLPLPIPRELAHLSSGGLCPPSS